MLVKMDVKSAFRIVPVHPSDRLLHACNGMVTGMQMCCCCLG